MLIRINFLIKWVIISLFFVLFSPFVFAVTISDASNATVVGYWQTVNGKTKQPSSVIELRPNGQFYFGKVVKLFPAPGAKPAICTTCKGARKNKPVLGLTIVDKMICRPNYCSKGTILDPRNGNVYHATMHLIDHGQLLKVRGYIGMPLFGKTVVWQRVSQKILG